MYYYTAATLKGVIYMKEGMSRGSVGVASRGGERSISMRISAPSLGVTETFTTKVGSPLRLGAFSPAVHGAEQKIGFKGLAPMPKFDKASVLSAKPSMSESVAKQPRVVPASTFGAFRVPGLEQVATKKPKEIKTVFIGDTSRFVTPNIMKPAMPDVTGSLPRRPKENIQQRRAVAPTREVSIAPQLLRRPIGEISKSEVRARVDSQRITVLTVELQRLAGKSEKSQVRIVDPVKEAVKRTLSEVKIPAIVAAGVVGEVRAPMVIPKHEILNDPTDKKKMQEKVRELYPTHGLAKTMHILQSKGYAVTLGEITAVVVQTLQETHEQPVPHAEKLSVATKKQQERQAVATSKEKLVRMAVPEQKKQQKTMETVDSRYLVFAHLVHQTRAAMVEFAARMSYASKVLNPLQTYLNKLTISGADIADYLHPTPDLISGLAKEKRVTDGSLEELRRRVAQEIPETESFGEAAGTALRINREIVPVDVAKTPDGSKISTKDVLLVLFGSDTDKNETSTA